ncbi:fatty acid oxygenase [Histoplasma capsulatum var. duboisii H88]|uniref:linoleate 8R-lipoxygenase n=1 Tax=Ajellomyces capsulatus (strain H88) TaxID=544711 RepID=F0UCG6_AJEC8|nr:fatty acid oxygenase [Histoplasma capsulatum var. duboisii H88]
MTIGLKKWAVSLCVRALLFPIVAAVKITSRMTGSCGKKALREEIEDGVLKLSQLIHSSLRPLPTQTGDGTYVDETPPEPSLIDDLNQVDIKDLETLADVIRNAATGAPVNDKDYIMERVIRLASSLPSRSPNADRLSNALLSLLWNDLKHPPLSYLGEQYVYRQADGSHNNILWPQIGIAGSSYARTVPSKSVQPAVLPDPGTLFDNLFRTDRDDYTRSLTSSYLDLAPLYGSNQEEQNTVRTFKDGKLKPDCFSEKRILGFPPGVGVLLIMFNRFHNYVVENLALINQDNRFPKPAEASGKAYAKYDNDLFQTGRLITCGLYINIILKDYVRTILNINRTDSDWSLDPRSESMRGLFGTAIDEAGGNQVSAEFNLVYRWHSCVSERDDKWTQNAYRELFGDGMDPNKISLSDFLRVLGKWEAGLSKDPLKRPFAKLARGSNGLFNDDDLANILTESIEDCAGPFGTSQIPAVFRAVEILGINQARSWRLSSLNEFRKHFNLKPHETFEDINPDPYIADQLKHLYDHPDNVELYPGLIVEEAKESLVPGSGLCANFTISRAILSDAVALVRGDRFYTVDQTPKNLTNWGFNEASYDNTVDKGHVFYKLFLRAFPSHFKPNSIYAHFPLVVPDENREILTQLNFARKYSWDKPARIPHPTMIGSYAACDAIIKNQKEFKVTWGEAIEFLMHKECNSFGRDFMLSGDEPPNAASRQMMGRALYHGEWEAEVKKFYEQITLKLLHEKSYKIAGVNQVDIVRDVANIAQVHFAVAVFSLPLKTGDNPRGIYTESELYMIMALVFTCIFVDADPAKSFPLRQAARKVTQQLGDIVLLNVQLIKQTGFLSNMVERLYGNNMLTEYGVHMIRRLLDSGLPPEQIVWTHMLPTAGGMVANQAQLFSQCLDYYLSEEGSIHLPEIHRLSKLGTAEADELLLKYFLEGSRLRATVGVFREVVTQSTIKDGVKTLKLKPGDRVACNLVKASMDPKKFPEPDKVDLTRDLDSYIHFGQGPHKCLGFGICNAALSTMLKTVGKLENLRRAPGPQGELRRIPGPGGISKYLVADYTSYFPFPTTMKVQWDGELPPCAD